MFTESIIAKIKSGQDSTLILLQNNTKLSIRES